MINASRTFKKKINCVKMFHNTFSLTESVKEIKFFAYYVAKGR